MLGVGLASILAVVTLSLTATGRLQLYINPAQAWFACAMAVVVLVGAVASFAIRPGDEQHDHDHGSASRAGTVAAIVGGSVATLVALAALALPPATLSAELAMERDTGASPLFAGADEVELGVVDTSGFGIGDWSATFATATSPEQYEGESVRLTGFVTTGDDGSANLSRLVITHCVIDAQSASLPVDSGLPGTLDTGQWIELTGDIVVADGGSLAISATSVETIAEPEEPYEY